MKWNASSLYSCIPPAGFVTIAGRMLLQHLSAAVDPEMHELVGERLQKSFDGKMYSGTIVRYRSGNRFIIEYDDGDAEDLPLKSIMPLLIEVRCHTLRCMYCHHTHD